VVTADGSKTSRYLNCGDWISHRSYVTVDDNGAHLRYWKP